MIHPVRQLAKAIVGANTPGTPLRHARGVVVSSTQGTSVVTLDGGATNVTAFNYGHAQNLAASTVVDVLVVGRKAYVLGAYTTAAAPPGVLADYAGSTAPAGWLLCNGTAVSRTTYSNLFFAIGTTWGAGDGSATFNVPDLRGRTAIGSGTGSGLSARTLAGTGGEETHLLASGEMPAHIHSINNPIGTGGLMQVADPTSTQGLMVTPSGVKVQGQPANSDSAGGGGAHNNMPPFAVVTKIIKT